MKRSFQNMCKTMSSYLLTFLLWSGLALVIGGACGLVGSLFSKSIGFVTALRGEHGWILYLLPLLGILSVAIYRLCHVKDVGTNQVLESVRSEQKVSPLLGVAIFTGAALTHLGGGSAGREGAALQLGGSISALFAKLFRLDDNARHILTLCGMAAFFSAIFGTPIGAAVFALEVVSVGNVCLAAIFPVFVSSVFAYWVATLFGVAAERFPVMLDFSSAVSLEAVWKITVIAVGASLLSLLFCNALHFSEKWAHKFLKNDFYRIAIGGMVIVGLTLLVGTTDYNGGGIPVIERIFSHGEVRYEAFALKLLFTVITVAAGYKGGEIVPTFFIGATFGGAVSLLLGLNPALGAAAGMAALFCGVTNCPLATLFLSVELFGGNSIVYIALAVAVSFLLSGNSSLYSGQKLLSSKLKE
jgi:H+/Cl- antiporter ClcA